MCTFNLRLIRSDDVYVLSVLGDYITRPLLKVHLCTKREWNHPLKFLAKWSQYVYIQLCTIHYACYVLA